MAKKKIRQRVKAWWQKMRAEPGPTEIEKRMRAASMELKHFQRVEAPRRGRKLAEKVRAGNYSIKDIEPAAIRFAVFSELRKKPGGKELVKKLQKQIEEHWRQTGQW